MGAILYREQLLSKRACCVPDSGRVLRVRATSFLRALASVDSGHVLAARDKKVDANDA